MAAFREAAPDQAELLDRLVEARLLVPSGVPGVYGRGSDLENFPHLAGTVFAFEGTEAQARAMAETAGRHEDWSEHQCMTDLMLTPAVCYPVYPAIGRRGTLPAGGVTVDPGASYAFRHEPS